MAGSVEELGALLGVVLVVRRLAGAGAAEVALEAGGSAVAEGVTWGEETAGASKT